MPPESSVLTPPAAAIAPPAGTQIPGTTPPGLQAGNAPTAPAAPAGGSWFPEAHKGFMETKGNPDPATFVESYINLEKLVGADPKSILRIPKEGDADAQAKFYNALGRPETADKYTAFDALKDDPLAKAMAPVAHELGLTDKQWQGLQAKLMEQTAAMQTAGATQSAAEEKAANAKRMDALKADVGADKMAEFTEHAHRAVRTAVPETYKDPGTGETLNRDQINARIEAALGPDLALRIFSTLGKFQAEDASVHGGPASGIMGRDAAQARIAQLQSDKAWGQRYISGGVAERAELDRLNMIVAAG